MPAEDPDDPGDPVPDMCPSDGSERPVPETSRAVWIDSFGPPEVLRFGRRPTPRPGPDQVLVEVHAASVNPRDWLIRAGRYPFRALLPRRPLILGSDVAGLVAEVGERVDGFRVGDRVVAMQPSRDGFGCYAEFVAVRAAAVVHLPEALDYPTAAALPLAGLTALQALRDEARLREGATVVIVGASGGVGSHAVQIARCLGARHVVGVASGDAEGLLRRLAVDTVVDYRRAAWQDVLMHEGRRADVVLDCFGRERVHTVRRVLTSRPAEPGTFVTTVPNLRSLSEWMLSAIPGRTRARTVLVRSRGADLQTLVDWVAEGRLHPVVGRQEPLAQVAAVHARAERWHSRGKSILLPRADGPNPAQPPRR